MRIGACAAVAVVFLAASGCGPAGCRVAGAVTRGGSPLSQATIYFEPDGMASPTAVVPIRDGRFEVPADKELIPGKYIVRITTAAWDEVSPRPPEFPQFLTAAELQPGRTEVNFDVPLNRKK